MNTNSMKFFKKITPLFILTTLCFLFVHCSNNQNTSTLWINSSKSPCTGVGKQSCMQVREDTTKQWQLFYNTIDGFTYEEGYIYKISVSKETIPQEKVPADGSSIKYSLIKVLSKTKEVLPDIAGTWKLTQLQNTQVDTIELQIVIPTTSNSFSGKAHCNSLRGNVKVSPNNTVSFFDVSSTRKTCPEQKDETLYLALLQKAQSFTIDGNILKLFNSNQELLLTYSKKI